MSEYKVSEIFTSINGEGMKSGELTTFIRFVGCNLSCPYCDTKYALGKNAEYKIMSAIEIYKYIVETGIKNVTLTGGEPLAQKDIEKLIKLLSTDKNIYVEIETNGSKSIKTYRGMYNRPSFTLDYKTPSSQMERFMDLENFNYVTKKDTVKFVCGSLEDLERMKQIVDGYDLIEKTNVFVSPIFGQINPVDIVEFLKKHHLNGVKLQLQIHKIIWNPNERGV